MRASMSTEAILSTVRQYLSVDPNIRIVLEPIKRGASGRTIVRVKSEVSEPLIGIHWTDERPDNDFFVPVANALKKARLRVPDVLYDHSRYRVALVEDLGDADLLSLSDRPFAERLPLYRSAMEQVDKLFFARIPKDLELMPPFDAGMYRWEQEYFIDGYVEGMLGMDASKLRADDRLHGLATRLGTSARHLVHRDFQSQNLLVNDGKVWMIDFQGMRRGRQEYDLASLIYDPYLNHSEDEREALLELWEDIADERPEPNLFRECAAQRLMQALGAYGHILKSRGDEWYRPHAATAVKMLADVVEGTALEPVLEPVFEKAIA